MIEALFRASAAVLLLALLCHHPPVRERLGPRGFWLVAAGALLPLLDPAYALLVSPDRIAFVLHPAWISGLTYGLLLIVGVAGFTAVVAGVKTGARTGAALLAGYLAHQFLAIFTPSGSPLWAPFSPRAVAVPIFSEGHPFLLGALILVLVMVELLPSRERVILVAGWVVVVFYASAGVGQFVAISQGAKVLAPPGTRLHIEPANPWLTEWIVSVTDRSDYLVRMHGLGMPRFEEPEEVPLWNDEALLARLLGDHIVSRFYFDIFRHPVVRVETQNAKLSLTMREVADQFAGQEGRTFYFQSDHDGRNRYYQVRRFQ